MRPPLKDPQIILPTLCYSHSTRSPTTCEGSYSHRTSTISAPDIPNHVGAKAANSSIAHAKRGMCASQTHGPGSPNSYSTRDASASDTGSSPARIVSWALPNLNNSGVIGRRRGYSQRSCSELPADLVVAMEVESASADGHSRD
ncbi:hypothetical protein K470DRAFT_258681 [Piedraia hortae CBS 480.64]|uniref:Uncharacterized protein n=1 Tax=Piedraia hortae CBS 480.64 TaxID=1314780 RepID=A0A6A7BYR6_9PEZI|nr:hypothetical protein K470DRAFT_258681 [Piedraia hortae CBS 480.64]